MESLKGLNWFLMVRLAVMLCSIFNSFSGITCIVAEITYFRGMIQGAKKLHEMLLRNIMRVPQAFFDTSPLGRILNRFSKDLDAVDVMLPEILLDLLYCIMEVSVCKGFYILTKSDRRDTVIVVYCYRATVG